MSACDVDLYELEDVLDIDLDLGGVGPPGPRGLNWRGVWDIATAYATRDAVQHLGSAWVAVGDNLGEEPTLIAADWDLLAAGSGGTGAAGTLGINDGSGGITGDDNLAWDASAHEIVGAGTELGLHATNDEYGAVRLLLHNRTNENGVIFELIPDDPTINLIDLLLRYPSGGGTIRLEGRAADTRLGIANEFQLGIPANPATVLGYGGLLQRYGLIRGQEGAVFTTTVLPTTTVSRFLWIATCNGVPTGTPALPAGVTGVTPLIFNTAVSPPDLYAYDFTAAAWALISGSGGGGGGVGNFADSEVPTGTIDGVNAAFTLAHTPTSGSVHLFRNMLRQYPTDDYTIAGGTITFVTAPATGDKLLADYRY